MSHNDTVKLSLGRGTEWSNLSLGKKTYLAGLFILLAAAYSQYLIRGVGPVFGTLLVYGVPIFAITLLCGRRIVSKATSHLYDAAKFGLGFFGVFSVLGVVITIFLLHVISEFDSQSLNLLSRPNPVLNVSPQLAWIMIWFLILIVGPAEEYLFRGFVFGGLLSVFKNRHWLSLAFVSSIFFAIVHLYYALVYGITSLIQFTDLVTFGMAMAMTYYLSGGDLIIPAVIHGVYDATGFISVAMSPSFGTVLRDVMIFLGIVLATMLLIQNGRKRRSRQHLLHVLPNIVTNLAYCFNSLRVLLNVPMQLFQCNLISCHYAAVARGQ